MSLPDINKTIAFIDDNDDFRTSAEDCFTLSGYIFHGYRSFETLILDLDDLLNAELGYMAIDGNQGIAGGVLDGKHTIDIVRSRSGILKVKCPILIGNSSDNEVPGAEFQNYGQSNFTLIALIDSLKH